MRIIPRLSGAALAVALSVVLSAALMLTSCVPTTTPAGPTPKTSTTPVFANEAEALAAATKAYAAYVKVSDEILADGGNNPERINEVATGSQLTADLSGFASARAERVHSVGSTTFELVVLQKYNQAQSKSGVVSIYLCEDVSRVDVLNASGISIVTAERPNRVKYQVTFDRSIEHLLEILVSSKNPWGDGGC